MRYSPLFKSGKNNKTPASFLIKNFLFVAPVVQRLDNAIHHIITIRWMSINKTYHAICWILIYPVDSIIQFNIQTIQAGTICTNYLLMNQSIITSTFENYLKDTDFSCGVLIPQEAQILFNFF